MWLKQSEKGRQVMWPLEAEVRPVGGSHAAFDSMVAAWARPPFLLYANLTFPDLTLHHPGSLVLVAGHFRSAQMPMGLKRDLRGHKSRGSTWLETSYIFPAC